MRLAGGQYSGFAVLARTRAVLQPIRALLEHHGEPVLLLINRGFADLLQIVDGALTPLRCRERLIGFRFGGDRFRRIAGV